MAINVSEAAKLLSTISDEDPKDAATLLRPEDFDTNFEKDLIEVSLANHRFGLLPSGNDDPEAKLLIEKISELITQAGGNIINVDEILSTRVKRNYLFCCMNLNMRWRLISKNQTHNLKPLNR